MATTEPGISPPATASEVGRHLRTVRKAKGLTRSEVARSAGLTRRELAAYERGRIPVPDSDLWCLAGSCGVDVSELLPSRDKLIANSDLGSLTVGDSVARLRAGASSDGLLREYLAMIYELRNLPPGTRPPMREEDLAALADTLGGTPEAIEARLHELIGVPRDEAARLRAMILPPRSLPAASANPLPDLSAYASTPYTAFDAPVPSAEPAFDFAMAATTVGDPDAADRFFAAPRVDDPFASAPPLEPLASMAPLDSPPAASPAPPAAPPAPPAAPSAPLAPPAPPASTAFDPFAPPTAAPIDPFAGAGGSPRDSDGPPAPPAMPTFDPFAPAPAADIPVEAPAAFDPGTFDPGTFDPGAFAADAVAEPGLPDPFPTDASDGFEDDGGAPFLADLGDDPAFAVEVVALAPDEPDAVLPEASEIEPLAALPDAPGESWLATWENLAENGNGSDADPFAALRVPLEEVYGADAEAAATDDPFGPEPGFGALAAAATEVPVEVPTDLSAPMPAELPVEVTDAVDAPDPDAFAHAYEPINEPAAAPVDVIAETPPPPAAPEAFAGAGADDDPDGEWFDRAAAATAALVADHLQAEQPATSEAPAEDQFVADTPPVAEPEPEPVAADEPVVDERIAADIDDDLEELALDEDALEDAELADALVAAPVAGLAPISWSLFPPAVTEDINAEETAEIWTVEDDGDPLDVPVEAGADAEAPATADAQFVAAGTDWQIGGIFPATAMADDGTLALRRADVRWALADLVAGDDFAVRATVDFTSGAGFGILFRVSVDDTERITGYSFDVDPIYGGGGFLLRQWHDNRQHWKPLAHAPVADPTRLYGHHTIEVQLRADQLTASVDGEVVLTVPKLSRCSIDSGREPCRGTRLGVQAWSTTEVTVDRLLLAS